jgi:hypothetical protein
MMMMAPGKRVGILFYSARQPGCLSLISIESNIIVGRSIFIIIISHQQWARGHPTLLNFFEKTTNGDNDNDDDDDDDALSTSLTKKIKKYRSLTRGVLPTTRRDYWWWLLLLSSSHQLIRCCYYYCYNYYYIAAINNNNQKEE